MAARAALVAALALLVAVTAGAQQRVPTLGQLAHRRWTTRDGAPSVIVTLAQSADGFLWIGATTGLYRFDGVRFERFEPAPGQSLLSAGIQTLHAAPDGSLLIGYNAGGISVLTDGRLTNHRLSDGVPVGSVMGLVRDAAGVVWVGTSTGLARLVDGKWERIGDDLGYPGGVTAHLLIDRRGTIWVAETTGVFALRRGATAFVRWAPTLDGAGGRTGYLQAAPDGSVWGQSPSRGLVRLTDPTGRAPVDSQSRRHDTKGFYYLLIDRQADAWLYAREEGGPFVRAPLRSVDEAHDASAVWEAPTPSQIAGMSGSTTTSMLEDREGTIWVGTLGGLDQFRPTKVNRVEWPRALIMPALVAGADGAVWMGSSSEGLAEIGDGGVVPHPGVPKLVTCAYRDVRGDLWFGGLGQLWHRTTQGLERVDLPVELTGNSCQAVALDRAGTLWLSMGGPSVRGVFRLRGGAWTRFEPDMAGAPGFPLVITSDTAGGTWLGYHDDRLLRITGDASQAFTPADGLHVGHIKAIHERGEHVWIGGEAGAGLLADGHFRPLVPANGVIDQVTGIVETSAGDVWINGAVGITRVPAAEVRQAVRAADYRVSVERFDFRDGVDGAPHPLRPLPSVIEGTDGRLWFTSFASVHWLDPLHLRRNTVVPGVHITSLEANGHRHPPDVRVDLSPGTRALTIAYTATSLVVPERVTFRYRLVGTDPDWQDAGARREAFYTNLDPGTYRFRVIAANDDGVWNEEGAALDIVIPPTFMQSNTFVALCGLAATGTILLLAGWRQRRVAAGLRARFEVALAERTRIAQELHDTLLQSFTGVALQLHGAIRVLGTRPVDAEQLLKDAVATADASVREARHLVSEMRAPELDVADLPDALSSVGGEAIRSRSAETASIRFEVLVRGNRRRLPHRVEVTALRIGREAILNAVRHASAHTVEVALDFDTDVLKMQIRDDGRGLAPSVVAASGRDGHWGIVGMIERAASVGGTIELAPAAGGGTLVSVALPTTGP